MWGKSSVGWLFLLFLSTEAIVMVAMTGLDMATVDGWLRTLWDVAAAILIIVPAICFWLNHKRIVSPERLPAIAIKTALIIFLVESGLGLFLQFLSLRLTGWQTVVAEGLAFAAMASPAVYYLVLRPSLKKTRSFVRTRSLPVCLTLCGLISFTVLVFDISLPLGVAGGVPYVALVLIGLWFPQRNAAIGLALAGTTLTIAGYLLSPEMGISWMVLTNRGLAVFAIWTTASLVLIHKRDIQKQQLAATVFNEVASGITVTDADNNIVTVNPAFEKITGFSLRDVVGRNPSVLRSGTHDKKFYQALWQSLNTNGSWQGEVWNRNKAGELYAERLLLSTLKDSGGRIVNHIALFQDISKQKEAEAKLQKKAEILHLLHTIAQSANTAKTIDEALRAGLNAVCDYTGWPIGHVYLLDPEISNRLIPSDIWNLVDPDTYAPFVDATKGVEIATGVGLPGRVLVSGRNAWIDDVRSDPNFPRAEIAAEVGVKSGFAVPVLAGADVVAVLEFFAAEIVEPDEELLQVLDDIGRQLGRVFERARSEEQLRHFADHDALTGLATARLGMDRLAGASAMARRNNSKAALLFIDLDGFKAVNDTFGHEAGDQLLKGVADRLTSCVREVDTVARIGGDEFMIVLSSINGKSGAEKVANSVIDTLSQPFELDTHVAIVGASIGIALYPEHGEQPEAIRKSADEAMYEVKRTGKNNYLFASG
jgi:diguanylate cyclase (GGDEF)-like protein/PAS domain S-box-containing protein